MDTDSTEKLTDKLILRAIQLDTNIVYLHDDDQALNTLRIIKMYAEQIENRILDKIGDNNE